MLSLIKSFFIMLNAHRGQRDKAGKIYVLHPIYVAMNVKGIRAKQVALLHDVLEDSKLYDIDDFSFLDYEQKEALLLLNHNKSQDYFEYIENIKRNNLAVEVKKADLKHNSNLKRLKVIKDVDLKRRNKYLKAMQILA